MDVDAGRLAPLDNAEEVRKDSTVGQRVGELNGVHAEETLLLNWEAIAAGAELLGAIGVIGSLVYLAGQVRSSGNQARQAAIQSVVNKMSTVWNQLAVESTGDLWVRGSRGISTLENETERVRFSAFLFSVFQPYEELYHYWRGGLVDDWTWESMSSVCQGLMGTPGFEDWWDVRGDWFSAEFQMYVADALKTAPTYRRFAT
jgi:hypothetical protein